MGKSSKKRERTDEDVADSHDAKPAVKKSKLDSAGKAEVTKKSSKVKEAKPEPVATEEAPEAKKEKKDKKDKKDKKEKKEKKSKSKDVAATAESDEPAPAAAPSEPEPADAEDAATNGTASADKKNKKKSKKDKKNKSGSSKDDDAPTTEATNGDANGDNTPDEDTTTDPASTTANGKPTRFICFVGNLPYSATAEDVRAHFATLQPTSVRLLTRRDDPTKSRGIAFVEFGRYDHMKTCLKKFHHTEFEERGAKGPPRRINVELTAGGGGKTAARQDKIKQKNAKLNEERANRMQREEEAKLEKAATGGKTQEQRDEDAIHPSRRARVPYGKN
ncbi:hypothetical protein B0I37DRAFT_350337 [Chaetomium sp. MPI-CAGE-AT-0009]|nr:hypothetical protein B0I37DRAFT_350337 [Chaetomium sp. MPI-CAGE-AT-0009]